MSCVPMWWNICGTGGPEELTNPQLQYSSRMGSTGHPSEPPKKAYFVPAGIGLIVSREVKKTFYRWMRSEISTSQICNQPLMWLMAMRSFLSDAADFIISVVHDCYPSRKPLVEMKWYAMLLTLTAVNTGQTFCLVQVFLSGVSHLRNTIRDSGIQAVRDGLQEETTLSLMTSTALHFGFEVSMYVLLHCYNTLTVLHDIASLIPPEGYYVSFGVLLISWALVSTFKNNRTVCIACAPLIKAYTHLMTVGIQVAFFTAIFLFVATLLWDKVFGWSTWFSSASFTFWSSTPDVAPEPFFSPLLNDVDDAKLIFQTAVKELIPSKDQAILALPAPHTATELQSGLAPAHQAPPTNPDCERPIFPQLRDSLATILWIGKSFLSYGF